MSTLDPRRVRWAVAAVAVEAIASGVLGEAWKKKRPWMIDQLRDHIIACGCRLHEIRALETLFAPREPVAG